MDYIVIGNVNIILFMTSKNFMNSFFPTVKAFTFTFPTVNFYKIDQSSRVSSEYDID